MARRRQSPGRIARSLSLVSFDSRSQLMLAEIGAPIRAGRSCASVTCADSLARSARPGRYSARRAQSDPTTARSRPGKVDARSERWREHRKKVRAEIVDAAFRAIDQRGPEVSLREIAEEAGTAKPKIYRHFNDKSDLFQAIGERLRDMLWAAIFPNINFAVDPAREVVRRSVDRVRQPRRPAPQRRAFHAAGPVRRAVRVHRCGRSTRAARSRWPWPRCSTTSCGRWNSTRRRCELAASATFGSASAATDWWLGPDSDSPRRMPSDDFVKHLTTIMLGTINGTASCWASTSTRTGRSERLCRGARGRAEPGRGLTAPNPIPAVSGTLVA